ncbi:hypothetical protein Pfl04_00990 [Planosporangium flavigriseum]|uniref:Uncharacterized protein n=1 Tax=Planosporangium flavigriseum TaxID=373681 RepID=A0A8J3LR82_9ACTN|nr:hypothetical protein Pfl04_00990 [Planosporangium flavigriseum]
MHSGPEPGAGMTALVANASGGSELPVVVTSHTLRLLPAMMNELADVLAEHLPPRCNRVRLVAWNSGCLHDDRPAPAYQLATRLGLEVIAPAGPLLGVPGGSLFAAAGRGAQRPGGWWRFAPGSAPSRVGWRYPVPQWDADLGEVGDLGNGLVVDQVPAGLWLHRAGYRSMTDLVFSVPVDPDNPALVVSHPDEEPLQREELARALAILPRRTAERLVFTPYGPDPVADGRLGEVAASLLGAPTRTRAGLPLYGSGGQRALVTVDCEGRPRWRPFVRELSCNPRTESVEPADWVNPAPEMLAEPIAPATYALGSGWAAEVIEAGLWIRPAHSADPAEWARGLPLDVDECAIVLGTPSGAYPPPPGALLAALLDQLPADARARIRFAVPRGAGDEITNLAAALAEQLPGEGKVQIVSAGGRRRARAASESARLTQPALREPTPYPPHPALREPTPYPPQPALREPTPYPPQPALREPTPYPPHPALREPTPYPPHPALREPTPYPPHPAVRQPAHAAPDATPPALREPTPYPPHPAVRQPTPYPPHPAVQQPAAQHAAPPSGRLPFPSSAQGVRQSSSPPAAAPPMAPMTPPAPTPVLPAPVPPPAHAARQPALPAMPPAPVSPAAFPPATRPVRQPGTPSMTRPTQPPARAPYPATRQPLLPPGTPIAPPPAHLGNQPQPVRAARQPFPQPAGPPMPQPGRRPAPPAPPAPEPPAERKIDDSQELLQRTEIRSHRTASGKGGRAVRDEEKATASDASELNRLLGFFDEIRKARAWDEEPAGSRPSAS